MQRNPSWQVQRLSAAHSKMGFSCGNESLDRYLQEQMGQDARRGCAAPFVLVLPGSSDISGFYTLSSFGLDVGELPPEFARKLPRYPLIPATLLGRLAVDRRHRGQRMGEFLLIDAMRRALEQSTEIASAALVVDAIDEGAIGFYRHFGFVVLPATPRQLFLPMKTIGKMFDQRRI